MQACGRVCPGSSSCGTINGNPQCLCQTLRCPLVSCETYPGFPTRHCPAAVEEGGDGLCKTFNTGNLRFLLVYVLQPGAPVITGMTLSVTDPSGVTISAANPSPPGTNGTMDSKERSGCFETMVTGASNVYWPTGTGSPPAGGYTISVGFGNTCDGLNPVPGNFTGGIQFQMQTAAIKTLDKPSPTEIDYAITSDFFASTSDGTPFTFNFTYPPPGL
ncbi:hypothetical protein ABPG75_003048 [Micractinium tetrahymenae]